MSQCGDQNDIFVYVLNVFIGIAIAVYFLPRKKNHPVVLNRERRRCAPMLNESLASSRRSCSVQDAAAAQLGRSSCSGAI